MRKHEKNEAEQEDRRIHNRILRLAGQREAPQPDPEAALEAILLDRHAGPAFLRWYGDEILQFWEGHCHDG